MRDSAGSEYKSDVQYQSFKDALHEGDPAPTGFCVKRGRLWCVRRPADRCGVALLALAALLLIGGITAPWTVDYLVARGIDSQTVLKGPSGKAYTTFVESGANLGLKIRYGVSYLNLTNPEAVLRGAKPLLQEVGPFVYHEHRRKVNVTFSADGREASFVLHKYYTFDAAATPGGLVDTRDRILTVHPVTQVLQVQLETTLKAQLKELVAPAVSWLAPLQRAVDAEIDESGLWKTAFKLVLCQGSPMGVSPFTVQTARDLYWGYHGDPILLAMQRLVGAMQQLAARIGKKLPLPVVPEAFPGLQPNMTSEAETARRVGPNAVLTGQKDTKGRLQSYTMFQNMTAVYACPDPTKGTPPAEGEMPACDVFQGAWGNRTAARHGYTPQWGSAAANEVKGTDGSMFEHPMEGDSIVTFQEDYRRWVELVYAGDVSDFHGVRLRRYVFSQEDFRNDSAMAADFYHDNLPTGLTNLSHIAGFPLYLSKPHLLEADPAVQARVEGLSPSVDAHLTFIDVEPRSGVTFRTNKRVQMNAGLSTLRFPALSRAAVSSFLGLLGLRATDREERCMRERAVWDFGPSPLFLPMVWYDEGFEMPGGFTQDFKQQVYGSQSAAKTFQVAGPLLGVLLALVAAVIMVRARRREKEARARGRTARYSSSALGEDILV